MKPLTPQEGQAALRMARSAILNNVEGWLPRQRLRLRLFLMGQVRPMKIDDAMALISWVFVSQTVFVLVGTTSFVSIVLFLANTLSFQEYLGTRVCDYLTRFTGYNISFESAIVPRWREGTIRLCNTRIICNDKTWTSLKIAEAKALGQEIDPGTIDINWTYWDLDVESIDITLSLWRWLDGRGIVQSAKLKGVRGTCDRSHLIWPDNWIPTRRIPEFGDFELDSFAVDDALISIKNPNFRPYNLSIFKCKLKNFRKQWLLYDFLCAESIVGSVDDCLFSVHQPQIKDLKLQKELERNWSKLVFLINQSNLKLYGLPIEHLNAETTGPFSWITKGTVDLDLHFLVPHSVHDEDLFDRILDEVDGVREIAMDKFESVIPSKILQKRERFSLKHMRHYGLQYTFRENDVESDEIIEDSLNPSHQEDLEDLIRPKSLDKVDPDSSIVMLWKVKLRDFKANVPIVNESLSYMSNAFIRPIVGFMNANKTLIELSLSAQMDVVTFY